ncbi:hypothetical protein FRB95_003982 [Tulasnella sp. JGI-2019a]|nr:hypothetical protein FRB95_003982 [Tulasnella sp. JGI-2019a]
MLSKSKAGVTPALGLIMDNEPPGGERGMTRITNQTEKLPIELLINIFGHVCGLCGGYYTDDDYKGHYVSKPHNMAQVCRRWLDIIKGAPELWTFISDRDPTIANLALVKSRSHPIGVVLKNLTIDPTAYSRLLKHAHRWIRVDIRLNSRDKDALRRLKEVRAPILQHLNVGFYAWDEHTTLPLDLFRDDSPRLTSLALESVTIGRWNSPIFGSSLRSLELTCIYAFGPTRTDLLAIFNACPELARLELTHVTLSDDGTGLPQGPRVQLPRLHTLILGPSSPTDAVDIAKMVETPNCRNYKVSRSLEPSHQNIIPAVALQIQQSFEACLASGKSLDIDLDGFWIHIRCRSDQTSSSDFDLQLAESGPYGPMVGWLNSMSLVRCPPLSPIPININLNYRSLPGLPSPPSHLLQLSNVRSLQITDYCGYTNHLVEALSFPRDRRSDGWLWPGLQEVTIRAFTGRPTTLLHMVKARAEASVRQEGTGLISEIVVLKRFQVERGIFTEDQFKVVRAALGDAAVLWPVIRGE